ncbi:MAG TPA: hypothetical protein PKI61_01315 [bacterium]|nr:hypothetical protein [bacterium]HPT29527.1 hypothetical protein [bacterium]
MENQVKESPLEKAKRLKAEKESKDQAKIEAESSAKAEKLGALNSQKQGLENQLDEINSKIEASRGEAHETRDTMQEAGLNKDEEFKGEYNSTISEVAGNLNELRNERNRIKAELEQINSNIENFEVNEAISEGKEATQEAVETVNQENEQAITQVENYPGAEAGDIKASQEIVSEINQEVNQVVKNSENNVKEVSGEKKEEKKEKTFDFDDIAKEITSDVAHLLNEEDKRLKIVKENILKMPKASKGDYEKIFAEEAVKFERRLYTVNNLLAKLEYPINRLAYQGKYDQDRDKNLKRQEELVNYINNIANTSPASQKETEIFNILREKIAKASDKETAGEKKEKTFEEVRQEVAVEVGNLVNAERNKLSDAELRVRNFQGGKEEYEKLRHDIYGIQWDARYLVDIDEKLEPLKIIATQSGKLKEFDKMHQDQTISDYKNFNKVAGELIEDLDKKMSKTS